MSKDYDSSAIQVLKGLDPVQRRPGMYTDTANPNHITQEIVDKKFEEMRNKRCQIYKSNKETSGVLCAMQGKIVE